MATSTDSGSVTGQPQTAPAVPTVTMLPNGHATLKQKRARSQLSCVPCRTGKLKCNREKPACDQCIKRSRDSACAFVPAPVKHKPTQNVKGRIRQLENLVVDLMNQNRQSVPSGGGEKQQQGTERAGRSDADDSQREQSVGPYSQPTPPSDNDTSPQFTNSTGQASESPSDDVGAATTPFGRMKISKSEIAYVGEGHWNAILSSISDLKKDLGDDDEDEDAEQSEYPVPPETTMNGWGSVPLGGAQPHATTGLGFMLGDSNTVTKAQLIAAVPEKRIADRLLSLWFNSPDPFKPIIHAPTFQDEYRKFWHNPEETPVMWLGLLFAILSLASSFGLRDGDPKSQHTQEVLAGVNKYHSLAASAAVLADFTKPKQYTIECLILYAAGLRSNNAFVNVWLMIGLIIRLALRMGYHRDPSHYPAITVFQGEMRRRVWAVISMIDVLISFQLGLPSMVRTIQSDTQAPRNLLDRDFNASSTVLPAGRGIDELTPSSYTRAKLRIVRIFAQASDISHATVPQAYEEVMRLDRDLQEAKACVPPLLQMPDLNELVTDPAEQLMCRFNIDLLYLKTKMTLHRRYMCKPTAKLTPAEQELGIGRSRKICIECALRVLQHHHTIYTASQAGGQLESVKWYMGSISTHDFLLAAMIICLELSSQINDTSMQASPAGIQCPRRRAMMDALENSQRIWSASSGRKKKTVRFTASDAHSTGEHMFDETEKASRAMAVMLEKVKKQFGEQLASSRSPRPAVSDTADSNAGADVDIAEGQVQDNFTGFHGSLEDVKLNPAWDDLADVSGLDYGSVQLPGGPFAASTEVAEFTSNPLTSGTDLFGNPMSSFTDDFAMIGNMLDVNTADLDWQMWDDEITSGQQVKASGWSDLSPEELGSGNASDLDSMRFGNALIGGSGPGNSTLPNAGGPISGNAFDLGQVSDMEFDMNVPLQDVSFDLGVTDYNRNGMYPATAAEWQDFERRKTAASR